MSEADSQRNKHASLLWGVLGVLVCSMLLYEAFLYNRLLSAQWTNAQYSAHVALSNVRLKLALGLRLGIPLDRYARAPLLVHEVSDVTGLPLALCNNMGDVLSIAGAFSAALLPQELTVTRDMQVIEGEDGRLALLPLLAGPDDKVVGCVAAFLHRKTLERETRLLCLRNAALHMLVVLLGVGLLSFTARRRPELFAHSARNLALGTLLVVLLICGSLSLYSFHQRYGENLLVNMDRTGLLLAQDFQRLTMADIPLENQAQAYLASVAANYNNAFSLSLLDAQGHAFASSEAGDVREPFAQRAFALTLDQEGPQLLLKAYLHWAPLWRNIREAGLDLLTLSVIAAVFMLELLLLQERMRPQGIVCAGQEQPALFVRPFLFFCALTSSSTLALIPLHMGELLTADAACREIFMSLPVMAQSGGIFLGAMLAGSVLKTSKPYSVALEGLVAISFGCLLCAGAWEPFLFTAGCGLLGVGFGCLNILAQVLTVREGLITDMYTGVQSGSICGVALGGLLAERLGNALIFGLSGMATLLLLLPIWQLGRQPVTRSTPETIALRGLLFTAVNRDNAAQPQKKAFPLRKILSVLCWGRFSQLLMLSVLPMGIVCGGILYFYLPVHLNALGYGQGDISRMLMLHSFVIICSGASCSRLVAHTQAKGAYVALSVALGALAVLALAWLPPLAGAATAMLALGLSKMLGKAAQGSYAISLPEGKALGVGSCVAVVDITFRVTSLLGPLAVSSCLLLGQTAGVLCGMGTIILGMACVLWLTSVSRLKSTKVQL
ncbi:MAG: MFS transporter [Desulfovibrio sp.]|nr:MFS transporter [Desulfovibrio sp.]